MLFEYAGFAYENFLSQSPVGLQRGAKYSVNFWKLSENF